MAKGKKPDKKPREKLENPDDVTSVKVYVSERDLITQAAGARGQTVADMFRSVQVRTFFAHLIVAAGEQAVKRLEGQEPPPE